MAKKAKAAIPETLELDYSLAELPSSQHRAGLAGLVLMVRWLERQPHRKGVCELTRLAGNGLTLRLNEAGLEELFNEVYAASLEEQPRDQPLKDKPHRRTETREFVDPKTQKTKTKTVYIYEGVVPKGAFLLDFDPTADGRNGLWIKLWRDVIWSIFRGVPATRKPFDDRANQKPTGDAAKAWRELAEPDDYTVDLPSTYFIGAQAANAENVPFLDRARFQFLLHFWPYAAQFYVPAIVDNKGERQFVGYALAVPDVADLATFCELLPDILRDPAYRGKEPARYYPRDSVVDLAVESGLALMSRFHQRLRALEGDRPTADLLLGVDVMHLKKEGNNIRLLSSGRVEPEVDLDEYATLRRALWSPLFRRQRLLNLINGNDWHVGFDSLMSKLPYEQTIGNSYFRRDARESFSNEVTTMNQTINEALAEPEAGDAALPENVSEETLIYRVVRNYLRHKLRFRQLEWKPEWKGIRDNKPAELKKFEEMQAKLAREAFLAIRSRTDQDFMAYFVSTLCSVPQVMSEQRYISLTNALLNDTDKIRTLTMLALAAQTPNPQGSTVPASSSS